MADYWQPVPLGWRDAPAVSALAVRVKKRDPRLLLLDLWDWAHCFGWTHPTSIAPEAIEKGAGWHGRRGALYAALVETGWVREADGVSSILRWKDDGIVVGRPTTRKVAAGKATIDPDEKRERDRLRKRKSRSNRRDIVESQSVTERDNCDGHSVSHVTPVTPMRKPLVLKQSVTAQEQEQEQEKDQSKNLALFASAASADAGAKPKRVKAKTEGGPNANEDRARWLEQARRLLSLTAEEAPETDKFCIRFAQTRKARGMEQMLRALEGLQNDAFAKTTDLMYLVSDSAITRGIAKWKKEAATSHPNRNWDDPKAGDLDSWL